tara:strand:+ start:137 stop:1495 length:1359 start_codon:yes stop_codon:yes gene_type:complete
MVSLNVEREEGKQSIRVGFTGQRLTAYGGTVLWSAFLHKVRFRDVLKKVLPEKGRAHNALSPRDIAVGFIAGILLGADKLTRISWLSKDEALHEVLGIRRMPSQSTFTRFFSRFRQPGAESLQQLYTWAMRRLPSRKRGYTLDLDSTALIHEDGHQEGVLTGYTRKGLKPCLHPLIAVLAEVKMVAGYWLRSGNCNDAGNVVELCRSLLAQLPSQIRISLVRADSGFVNEKLFELLDSKGIAYVVASALYANVKRLCRHDDAAWQPTTMVGVDIQEVEWNRTGQRLIVIRQRIAQRPDAGGKLLFDVPGYRFQALITSLPDYHSPLDVWCTYNGRADCENRIREIGSQFGIRGLCCKRFWATEAAHHLAIAAYNLCVLFQRELGFSRKVELRTLRMQLFCRAAVWSRSQNAPTLRIGLSKEHHSWWNQVLDRLLSPLPPSLLRCNAAELVRA